jgi:carboxyl-terminal processing protease
MDPLSRPAYRSISLPLLLLAFLGGVLMERYGLFPGSPAYVPAHVGDTFKPFWQAWGYVDEYYVDRAAVDPKRMTAGAIEGMLASLGDVGHTTYLSATELKQLESALKGHLEGIGARMTVRKQQPVIAQTMPGAPARASGLKPGDVLLKVNGKVVTGLPLRRIAEMVSGPAGTQVTLQVLRHGAPNVLTFHITRSKVDVPAVTWSMLPGVPAAHIAILEFGLHADDQLKEALTQARKKGARGVVIDVRGNPGGLKDQAVAVSSEFLKSGIVFIEKDAKGNEENVPVKPGGVATAVPLVLLIDEGSASSAEIFAGAIQDHHRGKLVGTKTFGTGTVLRQFKLGDGAAILLAVAEWLTPDGRQIWHKGITPDVDVTLPQGAEIVLPGDQNQLTAAALAKSDDNQLKRALEVLRQELAGADAAAVKAR